MHIYAYVRFSALFYSFVSMTFKTT